MDNEPLVGGVVALWWAHLLSWATAKANQEQVNVSVLVGPVVEELAASMVGPGASVFGCARGGRVIGEACKHRSTSCNDAIPVKELQRALLCVLCTTFVMQ